MGNISSSTQTFPSKSDISVITPWNSSTTSDSVNTSKSLLSFHNQPSTHLSEYRTESSNIQPLLIANKTENDKKPFASQSSVVNEHKNIFTQMQANPELLTNKRSDYQPKITKSMQMNLNSNQPSVHMSMAEYKNIIQQMWKMLQQQQQEIQSLKKRMRALEEENVQIKNGNFELSNKRNNILVAQLRNIVPSSSNTKIATNINTNAPIHSSSTDSILRKHKNTALDPVSKQMSQKIVNPGMKQNNHSPFQHKIQSQSSIDFSDSCRNITKKIHLKTLFKNNSESQQLLSVFNHPQLYPRITQKSHQMLCQMPALEVEQNIEMMADLKKERKERKPFVSQSTVVNDDAVQPSSMIANKKIRKKRFYGCKKNNNNKRKMAPVKHELQPKRKKIKLE